MKIKQFFTVSIASVMALSCTPPKKQNQDARQAFTGANGEVKIITLDPGHFHAALVQKTSYPQVSKDVYVYAPEGDDVQEHLKKIDAYNTRADSPTQWNEIVYTGSDFLEKMLTEKKGNVMITAGNNKKKTEYIKRTLEAGINVLADKPMAINTENFEMLKECFEIAKKNNILLYDIMTERHEITTILQRELSMITDVYGEQEKGTLENPAVTKESVHNFYKVVSGNPLKRPAWFYDVEQQGEGIVDVTTHLVDLIQWECFPNVILDYTKDIKIDSASRWTTNLSKAQFEESTGLSEFPEYLSKYVNGDSLDVYSNGEINYQLKDIHAKVVVTWNFQAPEGGGDTHYSVMRGTKANLIIRQGKEQNFKPELYIEATQNVKEIKAFEETLNKNFTALQDKFPGIELEKESKAKSWHVIIPDKYRVGHEAHFGQVTQDFLQYLIDGKLPDWEIPNMIAKYYTTTQALKMAKEKDKSVK